MVKKLINIEDDLFHKIQLLSISRRVTAQRIIDEAIEQYFDKPSMLKNSEIKSKVSYIEDDTF